jgi:hypothetical protein
LALRHDKSHSIDDICLTLYISRATLYRYIKQGQQIPGEGLARSDAR